MESKTSDTSPVRSGEELNWKLLEDYLRECLPSKFDGELEAKARVEVTQFPGGHSNLTYCVSFGDREFVMRRPPLGPVAPTAHDMPREYRFLSAVNPYFDLAPRPYLLCEDMSVIGAPFYIMERRNGIVVRQTIPAEIGDDLKLRREICENLVDTLANLHAVDIQSTGLINLGKPAGFVRRQVEGWAGRWERSKTTELKEMNETAAWLLEKLPPECDAPTLVHNDYKLDNVMLDKHDPARIVAVLDWEMCTVGDPLIDLGALLSYWSQEDDPEILAGSLRGVTASPGWMKRADIAERYAERSGRDLSEIGYYYTFATFKLAVIIQQIYYRYHVGQTRDSRFADFDKRVEALAKWARTMSQNKL